MIVQRAHDLGQKTVRKEKGKREGKIRKGRMKVRGRDNELSALRLKVIEAEKKMIGQETMTQ
jgi:hypothetical protein